MIPDHVTEAFFRGEPSASIAFVINSTVRVLRGPRAGTVGSVVSLTAIQPEATYVVEDRDGRDLVAVQSDLEPFSD
jgi:hypothetical protein